MLTHAQSRTSYELAIIRREARHLGLADIFDAIRIGEAMRLGVSTIVALIDLPFRLHHLKQLGFEIVGESRLRALRDYPTLVLVWRGSEFSRRDDADHAISKPTNSLESDSSVQVTSNDTGWCTQVPSTLNKEFIEYAADASRPVLDIGGGIGLSSIEALRGGSQVILNDIEPKHLQVFSQKAGAEGLLHFKLALALSRRSLF